MRIFFIIFLILSCGISAFCQRMTPEEYIHQYRDIAISEMRRTGVPAAITLAQGLLESEYGNSALTRKSNNHFGIKCKSNWNGPSVSHNDDEEGECFRAYENAEDSYRDHSDFLKNSQRYAFLFNLKPTDYKSWARGLKKAGYATNPQYADMLIKNIEKYQLEQYTVAAQLPLFNTPEYRKGMADITPEKFPGALEPDFKEIREVSINGLKALQVPAGTSLLSIAMKHKIRLSRILEINEITKEGLLQNNQIIFLEKKRSEGNRPFVIAKAGESIYDLAQREGVLLASVCEFNNCNQNKKFEDGDTVYTQPPNTVSFLDEAIENKNKMFLFHANSTKAGEYPNRNLLANAEMLPEQIFSAI